MNIDEAIKHCYEFAESKCGDCGKEHLQLARWLEELKESWNLINCQKIEIEGLEETRYELACIIDELREERERLLQKLQQAKSEAIKEFAERLKNKIWYSDSCNLERTITPEIITNLVKEMTEVQE